MRRDITSTLKPSRAVAAGDAISKIERNYRYSRYAACRCVYLTKRALLNDAWLPWDFPRPASAVRGKRQAQFDTSGGE